jgi:uncharacterized delta-60 repeat protein
LEQPKDRTNNFGTVATFRIVAEGTEPLSFQWVKDGAPLAAGNSSTLVLTNVSGADAGDYNVIVSNSGGSSTSSVARLAVIDPVIHGQPSSVWVNAGSPVTLSISAEGTGLAYQWNKDGQPIPGATSSTFGIQSAAASDTGVYQVFVTGTYGNFESAIVSVHVNYALPDAWNPQYDATSEWYPIQAVAVRNNELYLGGIFQTIAEPKRRHFIKFNGDDSVDTGLAPEFAGGDYGGVTGICLAPDGGLLIGGNFLTIAEVSQSHLARLRPDGSVDEQFRPVIDGKTEGLYTQVDDIEVQPDGRILIVGGFSSVNGEPRPGVARLLPDGTLDSSFEPDALDVPPVSWGVLSLPDGKLIVYGWGMRRLNPDGSIDLSFTEAINADSFGNVKLLSNGQLLVDSQASVAEPNITLLNADGTPDLEFTGSATHGSLGGVQANGKFLVSQIRDDIPQIAVNAGVTNTNFITAYVILRFNPDGTEDPSFSATINSFGGAEAIRADGGIIVAGDFTEITGQSLSKLARLRNPEPATQQLSFEGNTASWFRGGSSPEVNRTVFEFSSDGRNWTNLGAGVRISGGWKLDDLQLNSPGTLRARGFVDGSIYETAIEIGAGIKLESPGYNSEKDAVMLRTTSAVEGNTFLQMSSDLREWKNVRTNSAGVMSIQLSLTNLTSPHAFFRLLQNDN